MKPWSESMIWLFFFKTRVCFNCGSMSRQRTLAESWLVSALWFLQCWCLPRCQPRSAAWLVWSWSWQRGLSCALHLLPHSKNGWVSFVAAAINTGAPVVAEADATGLLEQSRPRQSAVFYCTCYAFSPSPPAAICLCMLSNLMHTGILILLGYCKILHPLLCSVFIHRLQ